MKNYLIAGLLAVSSLSPLSANALGIDIAGSSSIAALSTSISGANLSLPGTITVDLVFFGSGTGDYTNLLGTQLVSTTPPLTFNLGNMASWNLLTTNFTYTVSELLVTGQSADFLNVYTRGTYTPLVPGFIGAQPGGCATGGNSCNATDTSLRWSFTKSGGSVSASATLNSPSLPPTIPEPETLGLLGIGLLGFAASRRRKAA